METGILTNEKGQKASKLDITIIYVVKVNLNYYKLISILSSGCFHEGE